MSVGLTDGTNANITGFTAPVLADRGYKITDKAKIYQTAFGDGYEQRLASGINALDQEFTLSFKTSPAAEIDKLVSFFTTLNGVTPCTYTYHNSLDGGTSTSVKAIALEWTKTQDQATIASLDVKLRRVYEP